MMVKDIVIDAQIRDAWRQGSPLTEIAIVTDLSNADLIRRISTMRLPERDHLRRVAPPAGNPQGGATSKK